MLSLPPAAFLGGLVLYIEYNGTYFYFDRFHVRRASSYLWEVWTPWEKVSFFEGEKFYLKLTPISKCKCVLKKTRVKRAPFLPPPVFMSGSILFFSNDFSFDVSANRFRGKRGKGALIYQDDYLRVFYDPQEGKFRGYFFDRKKEIFDVLFLTENLLVSSKGVFQKTERGWGKGALVRDVSRRIKEGWKLFTYMDSLYFYRDDVVVMPWGNMSSEEIYPGSRIALVAGTYYLPVAVVVAGSSERYFFLTPKGAVDLEKELGKFQ